MAINRITAFSLFFSTVGTEIAGRLIIFCIAAVSIIISFWLTWFGRNQNSTHHRREHEEKWGREFHIVCLSSVVCVVVCVVLCALFVCNAVVGVVALIIQKRSKIKVNPVLFYS